MSRPPLSHLWPANRQRAFTLVEIAVVVAIIGLLAALAVPTYRKVMLKSKATAAVNDLRTFSAAFANFNLANSRFPSASGIPGDRAEIGNGITDVFANPSPIGGKYLWHADPAGVSSPPYGKAALGIVTDGDFKLSDDMELLELVDQMIDDGNLSTGNLQLGAGELYYVIEQ